jgi:hypothetical protein
LFLCDENLKNDGSQSIIIINCQTVPTVCPKAAASRRLEDIVQAKQQVS